MGLIFDHPPNNNSIIGVNLNYVIDDQMLMWNYELHKDKDR